MILYGRTNLCYDPGSDHIPGNAEITGIQELPGVEGRVLNLDETTTGILSFDRTRSGMRRDVICKRKVKVSTIGHRIKLRIVLDEYSAEIFINDGEQVMSSIFYTPLDAQGITFQVDGTLSADVVKHDICVS